MEGIITHYNEQEESGIITTEEKVQYPFNKEAVLAASEIQLNMKVTFQLNDQLAVNIIPIKEPMAAAENQDTEIPTTKFVPKLLKVLLRSFLFVLRVIFLLPLDIWRGSFEWLFRNSSGGIFNNLPKDFKMIGCMLAMQHIFIFMVYVIAPFAIIISFFVAGNSHHSFSFWQAILKSVATGLICYFLPLLYAFSKEILSLILDVGRYVTRKDQ